MVAAAVIGGSAISGIGGLIGSSQAASGAQQAAATEAAAQDRATQASLQEQQNAIAAEQQGYANAAQWEAPIYDTGLWGLNEMTGEVRGTPGMGVPGQSGLLGAMPSLTDITQLPGYSFTLDQGLKATQNAAAAQGLGSSGAALKGASTYAENLANTYYNNYLQNYWTNQNNRYNMLYNLAGFGSGSANAMASAAVGAGNTGAQASTAAGQQIASTIANTSQGIAQAQQSAANLQGAGFTGAASSIGSALSNPLVANALFGGGSTINSTVQPGQGFNTAAGGDYGGVA